MNSQSTTRTANTPEPHRRQLDLEALARFGRWWEALQSAEQAKTVPSKDTARKVG